MAFMANLNVCAEKAAQNIWVTGSSDPGSQECVVSVKALSGVPQTSLWRRGKKVKGNNVLPGTAIATFPKSGGNGHGFRFEGHAAIFVRYTATGIEVYDQWKPKPSSSGKTFGKRVIPFKCWGHVSDDAEAFFVIELAEVPSHEPALCGPSSHV